MNDVIDRWVTIGDGGVGTMTDQTDLSAVTAEMARMRERMAELEAEVARLRSGSPSAAASPEPPPSDEPLDEPLGRRAALRRAGLMAAGAVAGGAALAATTASPAAAATVTGSGNPGVSAQGVGGDGVSANTNTSGRSGVYATTGTTGAWGVFAAHSGGGQALQASASPTTASGKPVAAVNNDGTGMALKATGNPAVVANATNSGPAVQATGNPAVSATATSSANPAVSATAATTGLAIQGTSAGPVAARVTGGGYEAVTTGQGTFGVRIEGHDVGLSTDQCQLANLRLRPVTGGTPTGRVGSAGVRGDVVHDGTDLWYCIEPGTPGVWRKLSGSQTAGALTVLPAPVRVYDSEPGQPPTTVGPKTPMGTITARVLDVAVNSSGVPYGASAAVIVLTVRPLGGVGGSAIVTAAGVAFPTAPRSITWNAGDSHVSATILTGLDYAACLNVGTYSPCDIAIDVVGYYR